MALTGGSFPQGGNVGGFNQPTQITARTPETRVEKEERLKAEDAKEALLSGRQQPGQPGDVVEQKKLVRVKVRRNNGQQATESTNGSGGAQGAQGARGARGGGQAGQAGGNQTAAQARLSDSFLVRASVLFQNNKADNLPQQPANSNLGVRNKMLNGLNNYIQNDYQMMKLNPDDKAFTYRTAEARQLGATIGQMVASTTRQGNTNTKGTAGTEDTSPRLSPEAFGRQKGLLRRLAAMSESNPRLPDNLPTDYRPFESVA